MKKWAKEEDSKYSWLYENNYPIGAPMRIIKKYNIKSAEKCIDLGCGRASLSMHFSDYTGVDVSNYIIEHNKKTRIGTFIHCSLDDLANITEKYDVAICSDVMEHIPKNEIDNVLKSISSLISSHFYFAISTRKSVLLDKEGNNLHLSVLTSEEWKKHITKYFKILDEESINSLYTVKCERI